MPDPDLPSPLRASSATTAPVRRPANPWAIIGLILGLVGQLLPYLQSLGFEGGRTLTSLVTAVLALVFSGVGLFYARRGRSGIGMSSAGLTCALLALVGWGWRLLVVLSFRHWTF